MPYTLWWTWVCTSALQASKKGVLKVETGLRGSCIAGFAGSRSGALIATAWASLIHTGYEGYLKHTDSIMQVRIPKSTRASGDYGPNDFIGCQCHSNQLLL